MPGMQTLRVFRAFVWILCFVLVPAKTWASAFVEFAGARSLAMGGAHRGLGTGNDTLILNPAGLAISKRYSIDALYNYGTQDHISHAHLSAVDSKNSPVAAGVGYTRDWGNPSDTDASLNRVYMGMAYGLTQALAFGINVQNLRGAITDDGTRQHLSSYNTSVGMMANLSSILGLGVVYHNVIPNTHDRLLPPTLGFGAGLRLGMVSVAADLKKDMRKEHADPLTFGVGAEAFVRQAYAVRAGFRRAPNEVVQNPAVLANYISGGVAAVSPGGSLLVSFENLLGSSQWVVVAGMQFFM